MCIRDRGVFGDAFSYLTQSIGLTRSDKLRTKDKRQVSGEVNN